VIPPEIVILVVAPITRLIVIAPIARPVGPTISRPVGATVARPAGATFARPARKAIVYLEASVQTYARPVIISASRRPMMKAIATAVAVAKVATTPKVTAATAATATTAAAPPGVAIVDGQDQHRYGQRACCETFNERPRL